MAERKKVSTLSGDLIAHKGEAAPSEAGDSKRKEDTIAVTVRLPIPLYRRLIAFVLSSSERIRITNQDILVAALETYLENNE